MAYYRENRKTGRQMTPAQKQQFERFQKKGREALKHKRKRAQAGEKAIETAESALGIGFGGSMAKSGLSSFAGKAPRIGEGIKKKSILRNLKKSKKLGKISKFKALGKYGGAMGYTALGGLMLGEGVSTLLRRKKERKAKAKKQERRFSAQDWA